MRVVFQTGENQISGAFFKKDPSQALKNGKYYSVPWGDSFLTGDFRTGLYS